MRMNFDLCWRYYSYFCNECLLFYSSSIKIALMNNDGAMVVITDVVCQGNDGLQICNSY